VVATDDTDPLVAAARGIPADVIAAVTPEQAVAWAEAGFSLFEGRSLRHGRATAYDCSAFVCRLPVTEVDQLGR
jgi:uncharacterized protein YyaL (SSP411 family)